MTGTDPLSSSARSRWLAVPAILWAGLGFAAPAQADIAVEDAYGNLVVQSLRIRRPGEGMCHEVASCEEAARIMCSTPMRLFPSSADVPCDSACASPDELKALIARSDCGSKGPKPRSSP